MADWQDVARLAAPFAPTVGKLLGGALFPGGALAGEWAGNLLAQKFGVPATPDAVEQAIRSQPVESVGAAFVNAEQEAQAEWAARAEIAKAEAGDRTAQSQAINETMREEIAAGVSWWHWRHVLGYIPVLLGLEVVGMVGLTGLGYMSAADLVAIMTAVTAFIGIVSALLGFIANDSTRLKETAITGQQRPSVVATVAAKVTGRK